MGSMWDMPPWRDAASGRVMIWDDTSHTYVVAPDGETDPDIPDRSHASGGDNDLFDPVKHREVAKNPLAEGILASVSVVCPACQIETHAKSCPNCGRSLEPEWHKVDEPDIYLESPPQHRHPSEFYSDPERVPKPNRDKTDNSFPSMIT